MEIVVNIDGKICWGEEGRISVLDHGFLFGDSVYEVVRTRGGRLFCFPEHLERLRYSAEKIGLRLPLEGEGWRREIRAMLEWSGLEVDVYIRLIATRGVGELSLNPFSCVRPSYILIVAPLPVYPRRYYTEGCRVELTGVVQPFYGGGGSNIKSGNYLHHVLALREAKRVGAVEGIMRNVEGYITEGSTSNIFFVRGGILRTPALRCGILAGITRGLVLELAEGLGIATEEVEVGVEDLFAAEEVFITSTTKDIMPVGRIGERRWGVGPLTRRLMEAFEAGVERHLMEI